MPARFKIYDNGGASHDRYTILDSKPVVTRGQRYYSYFGFSENPYHPQGVGLHGELTSGQYMQCTITRFRNWGKRIAGKDLPERAQRSIKSFMKESEGSAASIRTAMNLHAEDAT